MAADNAGSAALKAALERLLSPDPEVQRNAALEIAELGDRQAIGPLTKAFHTENWLVRGACVRAIVAIGGDAALQDFAQALHEGDARIRNAAVEIFRGMGRRAVEPLLKLLAETDPNVVRYSVELLGEIGDPGAVDAVLAAFERSTDENVRYQSLLTLGKLGNQKAIPAIRKGLFDSLWVQTAALEAAGMLEAEDLEEDLIGLIGKTEIWALPTVLDALGQVGTQGAIAPLYQFIVTDEELAQLALRALARVAFRPGVRVHFEGRERDNILGVARKAIGSEDAELRRAGIDMAGILKDETLMGKLVSLLSSGGDQGSEELDDEEQSAVARALRAMGPVAERPILDGFTSLDLTGQILAIEVLGHIGGKETGKLLIQLLDHEDVEINRVACEALGQIADPEFAEALIWQFQHPVAAVRSAAQRALGRFPPESVYEKLVGLLEDPLDDVRAMAAGTLGDLRDQRAVEPLKQLLIDSSNQVKQAAVFALATLEERKVGSLPLLLLGNDDPVLRRSAAQVLGTLRDRRAVEPLMYLLGDADYWVRFHAARALGEIGPGDINDERPIKPLRRRLSDEVGLVRVAAAEALEKYLGPECVDVILPLVQDGDADVRRAVVQLLGRQPGIAARKAVIEAMRDPAWKVRHVAVEIAARVPDEDALRVVRECLRDEHVLVRQTANDLVAGMERAVGIGAAR